MESFFSAVGPTADSGAQIKVMRWPASLRLGHATVLTGKAIQMSSSGTSLLLPNLVREGEIGLLRVDAYIGGNSVCLQTRVSVVCCTCVGMNGFRLSLRFQDMDGDAMGALDTLLHAR